MRSAYLAGFTLAAPPGLAHVLKAKITVWQSAEAGVCLNNRTEISDGNNQHGYTKVNSESRRLDNQFGCEAGTNVNQAIGNLAARTDLWVWTQQNGWMDCHLSSWAVNQIQTATVIQAFYRTPPCGTNWYGDYGLALVYRGGWNGGAIYCCVYSPYAHYLIR